MAESVEKYPMQAYTGVNSSLYPTLDAPSITFLERANTLTALGRYEEAEHIYGQDLYTQRLIPVVVLGRAELALKQYKVGLLYRTLDEALHHASERGLDLDQPAFRLMAISRAFAAFSHKGICEPAVEEIARGQEWLKNVDVTDYTDIHVNYIRKYVLTVLFLALGSNYIKDSAGFVPRPTHEWTMWQGLTDLKVSLLERGMLNEALSLFKVERSRIPPIERLDAVLEFQDYVQSNFSLSNERSLWVEADLAIYAAQSLYESGEGGKGAIELTKADALLDEWCSSVGEKEKNDLTPSLEVKLTRLRYNDYDHDPNRYYKDSRELLALMKNCYHTSTTVCYGHAIEAARQLMTSSETDTYRATFYKLLYELQDYQENVLEDIRGMLFGQTPLFTEASGNTAMDTNKVLEWLDGFENKYPDFKVPQGLVYVSRTRRLIYMHRRQADKQEQEEAKIKKHELDCPTQVGALVAVRKSKSTNLSAGIRGKAEATFAMDIDEENFFTAWVNIAGKSKETRDYAMKLLVQWILLDLTTGIIKESEILCLMAMELEDDSKTGIRAQLEALSSDIAFRKLYLRHEEPSKMIIDTEKWAEKSELLKSWLERSSKPTCNGRQYLWTVLQEIRKESTIEYKAPIDVRVLEINRCISIVETLRPKVKAVVSPKVVLWKGSIADQYFLQCIQCNTFYSKEVGEHLKLSVDIGLEVIVEFQKLGDLMQSAYRQRSTGEMCLYKLYWMLLQSGQTMSKPDLVELQKLGLSCLEKADDFFTPLLQEVTWFRGLESIQETERSISTSASWRIPQLAVRLLVAGGIPVDEDKREAIWTWVQKSKARALAKAMGTTGKVPAELLQQIMASEQYRPLYGDMISLERQIQAAQPHNRFPSRQKLDMHMKKMRKHRLLAEVCDLQDGKALTLTELETLTMVSNTSVVLADWFYVSLDAYDEGSILLLTAKAGLAPTIVVLSTQPMEITTWVDNYLDGEFSNLGQKDTSSLTALAQPLANLSHSILRMCLWNAQEAAAVKSPLNPLVINGIPDVQGNEGWSAGRTSVQELARILDVTPYLDSSGTKADFLSTAPSSRLIHIHSHVEWIEADPLAHSIHFASTAPIADHDQHEKKLSAREIFALSLPLGAHVSLIACSGGLARVSPEDEVMGLVPALLHAGVSSTVSTLWPIEDQAGAGFTRVFYRRLLEAKSETAAGWVDMAKVFQSSVIERDEEEARGGRLHWTAFVMHGFWQLWVPPEKDGVIEEQLLET